MLVTSVYASCDCEARSGIKTATFIARRSCRNAVALLCELAVLNAIYSSAKVSLQVVGVCLVHVAIGNFGLGSQAAGI